MHFKRQMGKQTRKATPWITTQKNKESIVIYNRLSKSLENYILSKKNSNYYILYTI